MIKDNQSPLVSIIIPTYNQQENFLRECIESAIAQTYENIEIVISDNHSTNNASEILDEYVVKDKRIRVVRPPVFLNIAESFLFVFTQAVGKYSCYISSDDVLIPLCVEILVKKMEENDDVAFSHGKAIYFESDNKFTVRWEYFNDVNGVYGLNKEAVERMLSFEYVCFGGCMVRNSVWNKIINETKKEHLTVNYSLDILLVMLLFEKGNVYYHNDVLAKVRMENETRNSRLPFLIKDAATIWNFLDTDKAIVAKILQNNIDIQQYKKRHFIVLYKNLFYETSQGYLDLDKFKMALENLKLFKLQPPLLFSIFTWMIINFPKLSFKLYGNIRKIRNFRKS